MESLLLSFIVIPFFAALVLFLIPKKFEIVSSSIFILANLCNLVISIFLFPQNMAITIPLGTNLPDLAFRLYPLANCLLIAVWGLSSLIAIYTVVFMRKKPFNKAFLVFYILASGMVSGALASNNLLLLLFFWEGVLVSIIMMIGVGSPSAWKKAIKAFVIIGLSDLCMLAGVAITGALAGTLTISKIALQATDMGAFGFILLMIGAAAKGGAMPFHTWIPDASEEAPLPFMALLPAALEKILGIYFLARITLDLYRIMPHSIMSQILMWLGALIIVLAVMMALAQKNFKRLLSYHAISQVGYMILGIGTCLPIGVIGGLFHMINNAIYKSCLFLTGGAVEKQTGTTSLTDIGGLAKKMPFTFVFFAISAAAISGVWPFNGFFSKEMVYDAALNSGTVFYILAVVGSFFTAASFLKLGHSAFFGKLKEEHKNVREVSVPMLIVMGCLAGLCVLFGLWNQLPVKMIFGPALARNFGPDFIQEISGGPSTILVIITACVLLLAMLNHAFGVKRSGSGVHASDHITHLPVLRNVYAGAMKGYFDPYEIGRYVMRYFAKLLSFIDKAFDFIVAGITSLFAKASGKFLSFLHKGNYRAALIWAAIGFTVITVFIIIGVL